MIEPRLKILNTRFGGIAATDAAPGGSVKGPLNARFNRSGIKRQSNN